MSQIIPVISGSGMYVPPNVITNEELAKTFNEYVTIYNKKYEKEIADNRIAGMVESSAEFFFKASGIKQRHVVEPLGILNSTIMKPAIKKREVGELSIQAELGLLAAKNALFNANKEPKDVDCIIVSATCTLRAYPSISIEIQSALGASGYAFDMTAACSSSVFGIHLAKSLIQQKQANCVLLISPEIGTFMVDFCDRESHFLFGDAASCVVVESSNTASSDCIYEIANTELQTKFSNNIRSDFGISSRLTESCEDFLSGKLLFKQNGRVVFKEVVNYTSEAMKNFINNSNVNIADIKKFWLHQANLNMNNLIMLKLLDRYASPDEAPTVIDKYGNVASSGAVIAFHETKQSLKKGDLAYMCVFGAGYTFGHMLLTKSN